MTEPHGASFKKKLNDRIEPNSGPKPTEPITNVIVLNDDFALLGARGVNNWFQLYGILWVALWRGVATRFCMVYEFN